MHHWPRGGAVRGLVVYVHPFAEEMNKSRRMAAMQSRALADQGYAVLQIDLLGCGDSAGDFGDATWEHWGEDVVFGCQWLRGRHAVAADKPALPLWIWGLRTGCLLAAEAASRLGEACNLVFWQPFSAGKLGLQQFLRLKAAGELLNGQVKGAMEQLRADIASGRSVEVAGYTLSAALCQGLERASLRPPRASASPGRLLWFEVSTAEAPSLSPVGTNGASVWRDAGWSVRTGAVRGPSFWQTTEIEDAPELLALTCTTLAEAEATDQPPTTTAGRQDNEADIDVANPREEAFAFDCEGEALIGVVHRPHHDAPSGALSTGVVVIVGGPQYRAGSHRQFVSLARSLAAAGHPVLRFDSRGMGDSTGTLRQFEQITPDVRAASDALCRHVPQVQRIALWGLCDAASAALLYADAHPDARVRGLCLLNPWVRSDASLARTQVKHYYVQRLRQRGFWLKLLSGRVAGRAVLGLWSNLLKSRQIPGSSGPLPFQARMANAWRKFDGSLLLALSGDDYTAKEFLEFAHASPDWQGLLARRGLRRVDLPDADHTLSDSADQRAMNSITIQWLGSLA